MYFLFISSQPVYRIEERRHPHESAVDFINDVFNPMEKFEKIVSELVRKELKQMQFLNKND
jgi:hypothetical protein